MIRSLSVYIVYVESGSFMGSIYSWCGSNLEIKLDRVGIRMRMLGKYYGLVMRFLCCLGYVGRVFVYCGFLFFVFIR